MIAPQLLLPDADIGLPHSAHHIAGQHWVGEGDITLEHLCEVLRKGV